MLLLWVSQQLLIQKMELAENGSVTIGSVEGVFEMAEDRSFSFLQSGKSFGPSILI